MSVAVTSVETPLKQMVPEETPPSVHTALAGPARGTGAFQGSSGIPPQTVVPPREQVALVVLVFL